MLLDIWKVNAALQFHLWFNGRRAYLPKGAFHDCHVRKGKIGECGKVSFIFLIGFVAPIVEANVSIQDDARALWDGICFESLFEVDNIPMKVARNVKCHVTPFRRYVRGLRGT